MAPSKILLLDIEWKPTLAYVWRPYDETIGPDQIVEHGGLLCVGFKWLGKVKTHVLSEWEHGREEMLKGIHAALTEADAVVTYNGDKYDLKKLNGEFLLAGMGPPPPPTSIDVLKTVKKMGYFMSRLAFVGPFLNLGRKLEHEGIRLWIKVIEGDENAQRRMARYCKQDVVLLEKLYLKIRPHIANHPHLGGANPRECSACGSHHLQSRGTRRTRHYRIQRLHCQNCGAWQQGARTKIG